jgi:hypothetical protein
MAQVDQITIAVHLSQDVKVAFDVPVDITLKNLHRICEMYIPSDRYQLCYEINNEKFYLFSEYEWNTAKRLHISGANSSLRMAVVKSEFCRHIPEEMDSRFIKIIRDEISDEEEDQETNDEDSEGEVYYAEESDDEEPKSPTLMFREIYDRDSMTVQQFVDSNGISLSSPNYCLGVKCQSYNPLQEPQQVGYAPPLEEISEEAPEMTQDESRLVDMGFTNVEKNKDLLVKIGDINKVVDELLKQ